MKKVLSWFLIIQSLSLLTVGAYQLYLHETPSLLSFSNYSYAQPQDKVNQMAPSKISIPSLGINLPIYKATIVNNIWQTTDYGASYLATSPLPGNKGNSIIYGHNWTSLFGPLQNAKVGQEVIVTYPNGTKKTFVIEYTSVVSPDQSTILAPSNDQRLTLYTCTGLFDSQRFVAVAILKS
ncbi:MAG TPA: sortase [Candidatus Saccharimonadales bacterium]|nr:sortase [Candidatus Saccharimonadales bacterium]